MKKFWHYILEAFLIVFSVLFALFIENYVEAQKREKQKVFALERIRQEIERNSKIVAEWYPRHERIHALLERNALTGYDSLKKAMQPYNYFNMGVIFGNEPLANTLLSSTAWETARTTGIVSDFDFKLSEELTNLYTIQTVIMDNTLQGIVSLLFDPNTHDPQRLDVTLKQFELRFRELAGQEYLLSRDYNNVLTKLLAHGI